MKIVKMKEIILNNHKKYNDCVVIPIVGKAGTCFQHFGDMIFWKEISQNEADKIPEGNYAVTIKEKDGKLNFHFKPINKEPNALWLDLTSSELFHEEDEWKLVSGYGNYIKDIVYSGDEHHQNIFVGVFDEGSKLEQFVSTYKGTDGQWYNLYEVKDLELVGIFEV